MGWKKKKSWVLNGLLCAFNIFKHSAACERDTLFACLLLDIGKMFWGDEQACGNDGIERPTNGGDDTGLFGHQEESDCPNDVKPQCCGTTSGSEVIKNRNGPWQGYHQGKRAS